MAQGLEATGLVRLVAGRRVLDGIDLRVVPGTTLAVQGASGSGKSLLLRALAGLDPLDAGTLTWQGVGPAQTGWPAWRARITHVAQEGPTVPGTPAQTRQRVAGLAAQRGRAGDDPVQVAEALGLAPACWEQAWSTLSGGERQRAWLAIAVARRPDVLLLDEPTSALDPDATRAVEALLAGRTVVWVTHDPAQADRVGTTHLHLAAAPA